jgi:CubicO group peptidase (beta-lactamase class C family)
MSIVRNGLFALLLVIAGPVQAGACSPADDPASRTAQRMLEALVDVNGVPGIGAAVWRRDGIVWIGCAGSRDREAGLPVEADTIFRLASVSKVFAATAIARLAEQGRLDLDAPVATYLPWLPSRWAPITLRQLAAHASGLGHYIAADDALGERHFDTARAAVRWFIERPLVAAPRDRYEYSSWGYTLIGAVIEAVAGTHYIDYIQGEITPGLDVLQDGSGNDTRVSRLYDIGAGAPARVAGRDMSYTVPGGGMAATPAAVAAFGGRLMAGHIVSAESWNAMRQPFVLDDGSIAGERDYQVGLGWRSGRDEDGAAIAHHAGITEGARSALVVWPHEHTAASLLSNAIWVSSIERSAMLLAAPFREPPAGLVERECPLQAQRYRGTLGDANIRGALRFGIELGRCVGVLEPDPALAAAFAKATAWPHRQLQIVGLSDSGSLSRAALVTPYGLYELRAVDDGWRASLPAGELSLRMTADS